MSRKREKVNHREKTGWPAGLLQDDDKKLSQWFASRLDARWVIRRVCDEIEEKRKLRPTS